MLFRSRYRIRDTELLNRILRYVLANIGKIYAVKSIGDHLKNRGQRASAETIANYLRALEEAGLIYKVPRYDIRTGAILHNNVKYFLADPGLMQSGRPGAAGLQNTVFLDLERRGYKVATGRIQASAIDFVAERDGRRLYVQILDRRNTPEAIHDAARLFRKVRQPAAFLIVTRERPALLAGDHFRCMGLVDFLMAASLDPDQE